MCLRRCRAKHTRDNNKTQEIISKNRYWSIYMYIYIYRKSFFFFLSVPQSPLPAPLSARLSLPRSPLRSCPLLAKAENAPSASTRRWTRSSTPAATCACATTAAWSSRGRSTRAAPSAGGPSKTSSRRTGRDGSAHELAPRLLRRRSSPPQDGLDVDVCLEMSQTWTLRCLFFFFLPSLSCGGQGKKDSPGMTPAVVQRLQTQAHLFWQEK